MQSGLALTPLLSALMLAWLPVPRADAALSCPAVNTSGTTVTCTITADQGGNGAQITIDNTAPAGTGTNNGTFGGNYTVQNSASLTPTSPQAGIFIRLKGGAGSSDTSNNGTNGGAGGTISITNNGVISTNTTPTTNALGSAPGIWDDGGAQYGIYGASVGGIGANAANTVIGGGNGGAGGNGSNVTITNNSSGSITVSQLPYGGAGIYGASIGAVGGAQDDAASGDQVGGNGGSTNSVVISNNASINVISGSAGRHAWGIGAEVIGGDGGHYNGNGGSAGSLSTNGPTSITNTGNVTVQVNGSGMTEGVRGLYGLVQGGTGFTSEDGSDNGGDGGASYALNVTNSAVIAVTSTNAMSPPAGLSAVSGGIVMISQGGAGGASPQTVSNTSGERGGYGGNVLNTSTLTMNSGSAINTSGDYLPGVFVLSQGGVGGAGREDGNGAAGGVGGTIQINMNGNASIVTNGTQAYGIAARSAGGAGGYVETSSGAVDFSAENGGTGGNGGAVTITTTGGTIQTYGANAIGMLAQSMGGIGGGTTSNFELFGEPGANAGNGGTPGTVTITSATGITTSGDSSHGIVAQSIGGGGGAAGVSSGIVALGGSGGNAIGGGTVNVTQSSTVTTSGISSFGILAQSIGGGGGDGGGATGIVTIGGQAGSGGGSGGATTATLNGGSVKTTGDTSYGVVAQSIGGGGGTGGGASSLDVSLGFSFAVAVGGAGGDGGAASTANGVLTNASITTGTSGGTTTDSHGLVVQSIGGGGGAGGASVARAFAIAVPDDSASVGAAVSIAVGGSGGSGGSGGRAEADLAGSTITTYGAGSFGMLVQSIGGGGGAGGNATSTSTVIGTDSSSAATVSAAFGGNGGAAACTSALNTCASTTTVNLNGGNKIQTWGDSANGIVVQSIGGGGGAGGIGSASTSSRNTDADISATISLGGTGNGGGTAGTVVFNSTYTDSVITAGDGARGVLLQSIGGGGGASQGGQIGLSLSSESEDGSTDVSGTVNVGRGGASGGAGGPINLVSNGQITTYGADADGLLVQSIGGSGGLGGVAGGAAADPETGILRKVYGSFQDEGTSYELNVGVGGTGGGGGAGGAIGSISAPASLGSRINTYGDYADAAVLQSIGGGGGAGGASTTSSSSSSSHVTVSVGGKGGSGGSGGPIVVYFNDAFENGLSGNLFNTNGYGAMGVLVQSIGGGGGTGASGSPLANGHITVGRDGGGAGDGGSITVTSGSWANISTHGDSAYGLVLQSIGGGGGIGIAGDSDSAANPGKQQFSLTLGGRNGASGNGGTIDVTTGLGMNTYGDRAIGLLAQSIGGGGGVVTTGAASGLGALSLGGSSGSANTVNVNITGGSITTRGNGAHALVAQSIGGGGGIIGDTGAGIQVSAAKGGLPSGTISSGNGSSVTVTTNAALSTSGRNAFGIIAQSIGGGGGIAGSASNGYAGNLTDTSNGVASAVTVNQGGSISVTGAGSTGIFAQSQGPFNNGVITVNVNGSVAGGSSANGFGYGVWVAQGVNNVLNVGSSGSISAASGVAVHYDGDTLAASGNKLTITNNGVINGSVQCTDADTGANCGYTAPSPAAVSFIAIPTSAVLGDAATIQLHNAQGGTLSGASLYQADVTNEGQLIIGNPGPFNELRISNNFVQTSTGVIRADADFDRLNTDHLTVAGNATLAGGVNVVPTALLPNREVTVMTVQGQSQGALQALDSPVIDYGLRQDGQDFKVRAVAANFHAPAMSLGGNQGRVADFLQRIWDAGGNSALAPLFAQLDLSSRVGGGAYRGNLDSLSPGALAAPAAQSMAALGQFTGNMMSCPAFTSAGAAGSMTQEQNCFWGLVSGRSTKQDGDRGNSDFNYDSYTYQFGGQRQVSPGWFLGGSVAYQNNDLKGDGGRLKGNGDSGYAGLVLKRESGPWVFSGALGGGYGSYRMNRDIIVPGYQDQLKSNPDMYSFGLRLRAARTFGFDNLYVKPYVDFDANYTRMSSYSEKGNNALGLSVDSSHQYVLGISPMIEIGGRKDLPNGAYLRPFAYVGVIFLNKDKWNTNARLQGAPDGTGSFGSSTPMDDVIGRIGAGFQVSTAKGVDFRLQYDGELASRTKSHSGSLKVMVPF
ncbi:hypothetical protein ASB57_00250 [Bordetella sp. N]|nr:hypothetical protein ASB57_00250 [Bordetella sp. N]